MKLLYFTPMIIGLCFIFTIYYKCYKNEDSKLADKKITQEEYEKKIKVLAGGTCNLMMIWIFISFAIATACIFST